MMSSNVNHNSNRRGLPRSHSHSRNDCLATLGPCGPSTRLSHKSDPLSNKNRRNRLEASRSSNRYVFKKMSCCAGDNKAGQNACDLDKNCAFARCDSCPEQMVECQNQDCKGRVHPLCWKKLFNKDFSTASAGALKADKPLCSTKCAHVQLERSKKSAGRRPEGPR